MSKKEIYAFLEQCRNDKGLGEEVRRLAEEGKTDNDLLRIAAREGFTFTADEFVGAFKKGRGKATSQSQELSDEVLTRVSGGGAPYGECWRCKYPGINCSVCIAYEIITSPWK